MLIVGENINATRKAVAAAIKNRDDDFIAGLAISQDEAGADFIDVNAGSNYSAMEEKTEAMRWLVQTVQSATGKPLVIDSDEPEIIKAALEVCTSEKIMINSVTAESAKLETIGELAAGRGAWLVALAMGAGGIPDNVKQRLENCRIIMKALAAKGMQPGEVYFDPLVIPVSVDQNQAGVTLETIRAIKTEIPGTKTIMGLSNISYGLPSRRLINRSFLAMASASGLDVAILDPTDTRIMSVSRAGDVLTGRDKWCRRYSRAYRQGKLEK